jgi:hypothetical protein
MCLPCKGRLRPWLGCPCAATNSSVTRVYVFQIRITVSVVDCKLCQNLAPDRMQLLQLQPAQFDQLAAAAAPAVAGAALSPTPGLWKQGTMHPYLTALITFSTPCGITAFHCLYCECVAA